MWALGNIIIGGLITGAIYALLAVGYSLVFSVSGALNLAQGAFVALGALAMYSFSHTAHRGEIIHLPARAVDCSPRMARSAAGTATSMSRSSPAR